jgi:hypothetical protein
MIRIPVIDLRVARLAMGLDVHAPLLSDLAVAVRTETRLVAAIAVLRVVRGLDGMDRDKIGAMRLWHVLPSSRRTPLQIGRDPAALVTVDTEGLLMAVGAVIARLLRQQSVLLDEEGTMIAHHAGSAMAIVAFIRRAILIIPVVGPGEGETDERKEKGRGQQYDFQCPIVQHSLASHG